MLWNRVLSKVTLILNRIFFFLSSWHISHLQPLTSRCCLWVGFSLGVLLSSRPGPCLRFTRSLLFVACLAWRAAPFPWLGSLSVTKAGGVPSPPAPRAAPNTPSRCGTRAGERYPLCDKPPLSCGEARLCNLDVSQDSVFIFKEKATHLS